MSQCALKTSLKQELDAKLKTSKSVRQQPGIKLACMTLVMRCVAVYTYCFILGSKDYTNTGDGKALNTT